MNVLFDTNVVLDVLLDRVPFSEAASQLFAYVEYQRITGYLCSTTVTTVHYLASKGLGASRAKDEIRKLLHLFRIAPVDKRVLAAAAENDFTDFEDGVLYEAARHAGADSIVTRNEQDFTSAKLTIYPPPELVNMLRSMAS
ncbi:MAG: PIN domain-containing protein [Anaerolineales bacterium]|nr:PIN domain-containing protein [Anaerolineales bacterium]